MIRMPTHLERQRLEFQAVADHFQKELHGLRTGRASVGLVEGVRVEAYGQTVELKATASITTPDAKTIQIEPWDKSIVKDVEKALMNASLGIMPNVAGTVIRLVMPPMTEDGRKNLVKILRQKEEQAKIGVRNAREKVKTAVMEDEKNKLLSEDERRRQLEALDKTVAEWNDKIKKIAEDKEREILTV